MNVRSELLCHGLQVGQAIYEKCLYGSGIYPLETSKVVKAELADDSIAVDRLITEARSMKWMHHHSVAPSIYYTGCFRTTHGTVVYTIMARYMCDLGSVEDKLPCLLYHDDTVGWMINRLFRRTAYQARLLLTDLKPTNIVANFDSARTRISEVVLIDFGPEYCVPLDPDVSVRIAYLSMLLLYSTICTTLGFHHNANLILPYIQRQGQHNIRASLTWMDSQPVVLKSIRQYTMVQTASELHFMWIRSA
jgi:serine/threonine protein kinase